MPRIEISELMRRSRPVLALVFVLVLSSGCTVARCQYISLATVAEMRIETCDTPKLSNAYFVSKMPSRYSLERGSYQLSFQANLASYLPEILIAARNDDGEPLRLSERASRRVRDDRAVPCGSFGAPTAHEGEVRFSWVTCAEADESERFISFDVLTGEGLLLGSEDIPFVLEKTGFYMLPDMP